MYTYLILILTTAYGIFSCKLNIANYKYTNLSANPRVTGEMNKNDLKVFLRSMITAFKKYPSRISHRISFSLDPIFTLQMTIQNI